MKIANEFTVSAPIEQAWSRLCDLEQMIPLMPGAQLIGHEGDEYLGKVKVKVGPVTSEFSGKVHFVEQDRNQHRAVFDAKGKEARGTGNAAATVAAQLHEVGERTRVTVDTDLKIVGKLAQFGSGMLQQVSEKLLGQFVDSLEAELAAQSSESPQGTPCAATPTASGIHSGLAAPCSANSRDCTATRVSGSWCTPAATQCANSPWTAACRLTWTPGTTTDGCWNRCPRDLRKSRRRDPPVRRTELPAGYRHGVGNLSGGYAGQAAVVGG